MFARVRFEDALSGRTEFGNDDDDEVEDLKPRAFVGGDVVGQSDPRVRALLLDDPGRFCRGLVNGAGDCFCLKEMDECTVKRHQKFKAEIAAGRYHILCPKTGWAYISPSLDKDAVADYHSLMANMELGVAEWQCFFASACQHPIKSLDDFEERRLNLLDGAASSRTPRAIKKARTGSSPLSAAALPVVGSQVATPSQFLDWLTENWSGVDKSFANLGRVCANLSQDGKAVGSEIDVLSASVSLIRAEIGDRNANTQDLDVWTAIGNIRLTQRDSAGISTATQWSEFSKHCSSLELRLEDMEARLASMDQDSEIRNRVILQQLRGLAEAFPRHVGPARGLVDNITAQGSTNYGDLLEHRLTTLETGRARNGFAAFQNPEFDVTAFALMQAQVSKLMETAADQELELKRLRGRVGQVQVEIQGEVFQSVGDVEDFIKGSYANYTKGLFFDAVSLLQIVHGNMGKSGEEVIESEYHAMQSNYGSDLEAKYLASFKSVVLPTVFGSATSGATHACALPGIKIFLAWDPQDGLSDGEKQKILNGIENQVGAMTAAFENIYPAGSKLAAISNQLLGDSVLFIRNMCTFMTEFYTELCRTSSSGEAGNWGLTCQIVNRLFKDLATQRNGGGEARMIQDPIKRGAKYLWLTLQTHHVMREYVTAKFREHPSIAPMLNISLYKTVVTTEKFEALLRDLCKKLEVTTNNAKVMADKAFTAANAAKGPGKRDLKT